MILKFILSFIFLLSTISLSHAQDNYYDQCVAENGERGTQGQQEDRWSKSLIKKKYTEQHYNTYSGLIEIINEDTIKYDNQILIVNYTCKYLKLIFRKGLIYPEILTDDIKVQKGLVTKQGLDSLIVSSRNDSMQITDFEEIKFIKKKPNTKIFRFWLYSPGITNPTVCFVSLKNKTANRKTDIVTFISGSELTFFARGWIVI
jgi:hypothetical protein